jgi:hypothetical protein
MILVAGAPVRIGACLHIGAFILFPDRTMDIYTKHPLGAFSESARRDGTIPPAEATVFAPGGSGSAGSPRERRRRDRGPRRHRAAVACRTRGEPRRAVLSREHVRHSFGDRGRHRKARKPCARPPHGRAFANFGGPSGGLASGGQSSIWSPTGDLARLESSGAGIAIAMKTPDGWSAKSVVE